MHRPWPRAAALERPVDHTANDDIRDQFPEAETTTPPENMGQRLTVIIISHTLVKYSTV